MYFFLDSGVFLGLCDYKDAWHKESKNLLGKYPIQTNNYYSAKKVKDELRWKRLRSIKKGYTNTVLRKIEQCINRWLDKKMKGLLEYEKKNCGDFDYLCKEIKEIVDNQKNDAIIVTNAIFWSCKCDSLGNPTLISIDRNHILSNTDRIIEEAKSKCNRSIPLKIRSLEDI